MLWQSCTATLPGYGQNITMVFSPTPTDALCAASLWAAQTCTSALYEHSNSALQAAGGTSPWLQLLDCLCQWVWTHPPWWQPKSPMQFGSLPGMGRCVQVRGAVEPSPGGDARVSGRGGLGRGVGWDGDWGGGRGEEKGYPGNRLPLCMGESSGEETPLSWRMRVWGCIVRCEACHCTSVFVFVFVSYLLSWKFKQLQTLQFSSRESLSCLMKEKSV